MYDVKVAQITTLSYPKKSHRKEVNLPGESLLLAEFVGIMLGDGGINNAWQANVTLNTEADRQYIHFVGALMTTLFAADPRIMSRKTRKATVVSLASTSVVDFLVQKGLPRGNKLALGLRIPDWILARKAYKIACVRGLVDTDGCLVLHRHRVGKRIYRNLYLSFSTGSRELLEQVATVLIDVGLEVHLAGNGRELWLYSEKDVTSYLRIVGTSNDRLSRVYRDWRGG